MREYDNRKNKIKNPPEVAGWTGVVSDYVDLAAI